MRNDREFFTKKIKETLDQMKQKQTKFDIKIDPFQEALTNLSKLYNYIKENIVISFLCKNVIKFTFSVDFRARKFKQCSSSLFFSGRKIISTNNEHVNSQTIT